MKKNTVIFCLMVLTACATTDTELSGVVDPNYRDNFQVRKLVVVGSGMPIDEQKALENTLERSFTEYDVQVLRGLEVFPPTRDYSDQNAFEIARNWGADAILIVSSDSRDVSETYIPPKYHPGTSTSYISGYGDSTNVTTYTSPGYTTGGYSVSKPGMSVSVHLINTMNGETIWIAQGFSGGNAYTSFSDLTISVARKTVEELSSARLIVEKETL